MVAAFAGTVTAYSGNITVTDQPTLAELRAINAATTGTITLDVTADALSGTADDLVAAFAGTVTAYSGNITVTDQPTLAELKAINAATTGTITLDVTADALLARLMIWLRRLLVR